jgi:isopenicillin-N N-acyltransferase-like protein
VSGSGMEVVRVSGTPAERGRAAGTALAEPIHRSLAFYRAFLQRRGVGRGDLSRLLGPSRSAAERSLPDLVAEVDGLASGAGADPWEVFAVNAFEELEPLLAPVSAGTMERCTAFAVTGPEGTVLAHNEQWYAGDAGNAAVIVAQPDEGPAFASPAVVTCLPAVGMNAAGLAQGVMSLSAEDDGPGIPRVLVSRLALQAADLDDHVRRASIDGRSGGYGYVVAAVGGRARIVETSAAGHAILEGSGGHTNHYLDPELAERGDTSAGSTARLHRLQTLLAEREPRTPRDAMEILRDHEGELQSICLHPDPADGDEASSVLFSMVCHLEERRMWVAAGNPCTAPYEEIDIPEVA